MTRRFAALDLALYPVPDVLRPLDYEAYLTRAIAAFEATFKARAAADGAAVPVIDTLRLDSDPISIDLQVGAFSELLIRADVNDRVRALTLAGATGAALDHIGTTYFRTVRQAGEADERYRYRLALAPESWSTAGPAGAYAYWALAADSRVADVAVHSEDEGIALAPEVLVAVLPDATVEPGQVAALLATVKAALDRDGIRPLGDIPSVVAAVDDPVAVAVTLTVSSAVAAATVRQEAERQIAAYLDGRQRYIGDDLVGPVWRIGRTIRRDTIAAAARVAGVVDVTVTAPVADHNAPPAGYPPRPRLARAATTPLDPALTNWLLRAPRASSITVTTVSA